MRQYLSVFLIAGLIALVAARPWYQLNRMTGIATALDSLRADSVYQAGHDSLVIDPVAVTLPQIISDSLSYTVDARTKKKAYLEEQSALLQKDNQRLEAEVRKKQRKNQELQQTLVSLGEIEKLLLKQNGQQGRRADANNLGVSDLETELNKRAPALRKRDP